MDLSMTGREQSRQEPNEFSLPAADPAADAPADPPAAPASGEEPRPPAGASQSLRKVALGGGRLGAIAALMAQFLSVATTTVLVRLLTPRDIGLVAAATIVIGLFEVLADVGLGASVVQRESVNQRILSTTFWSCMVLGLGVAMAGSATASLAAGLMGNPEVRPFIVAVSVISFLGFAADVPKAVLQRRLSFKALYRANIASLVVYSATAVALAALTGLGAWSIVVARLVQIVLQYLAYTLASHWRPSLEFDVGVVKGDLRFNAGFWGNTLVSYAGKNADYWTVGRTAGAAPLGVYYVAYVLPNVVRQRMTWVAQDVLLPLLTRLSDDDDRLAAGYLRTARLVAFISYPVLFGIAVLSERIIGIFFGASWSGAVVPMQILAAAAAIETLTPLTGVVFISRGEPGRSFAVNGVRLVLLGAGLALATLVGGLTPVAVAVLASSVVAAIYGQMQVGRKLDIGLARVIRAVAPIGLASLVMVGAVRAADLISGARLGAIPALIVLVPVGAAAYAACGLLLYRGLFLSLARDLVEMARPSGSRPTTT